MQCNVAAARARTLLVSAPRGPCFFSLVDHYGYDRETAGLQGWIDGWGTELISIFWETLTNDSRTRPVVGTNATLGGRIQREHALSLRQSGFPKGG